MHGLGENKGRLRTQETGESKVKFLARYPAGRLRAQETGENTKRPARTEIGRPAVKFLARYPKGRLRTQRTARALRERREQRIMETYGQLPRSVGRPARALRERREQQDLRFNFVVANNAIIYFTGVSLSSVRRAGKSVWRQIS